MAMAGTIAQQLAHVVSQNRGFITAAQLLAVAKTRGFVSVKGIQGLLPIGSAHATAGTAGAPGPGRSLTHGRPLPPAGATTLRTRRSPNS